MTAMPATAPLLSAGRRLPKAGGWEEVSYPDGDRAAMALAESLAVSPWKVTDEMVETCRKHFKDAEVAEIFHHTCNAAFFNRVTEVARLPLEK